MKVKYLDTLNTIVETLWKNKAIRETIQNLKMKIRESQEPFIWSVIDVDSFQQNLPSNIKSIWVFVLKKNTPSIAHYHPNSTQHTVIIEGTGKVKIGDHFEELKLFGPQSDKSWYIIDKNTPHEFCPEEQDMLVISFHTCLSNELIEIGCDSGEQRLYERVQNNSDFA